MRRLLPALSFAVAGLLIGSVPAAEAQAPIVLNFESFPAGHVLTDADLPSGVSVNVQNTSGLPGHPDKAIFFLSDCPVSCSGGDYDLRTPGSGSGNNSPQGNLLIVAEDDVDSNSDGLVDDPDDEEGGGRIHFTFDEPHKLLSVRVIDIEQAEEFPSGVVIGLAAGGEQLIFYDEIGNNSAQTIVVDDPQPASSITFVFEGTGAIDDIEIVKACGDGIVDPGEQCDDGAANSDTEPNACRTDCVLASCGDGVVGIGEECDPPADGLCPTECRANCLCAFCGDGIVDSGEECDDGTGNSDTDPEACRTDCKIAFCGDGVLDNGIGEQCDPPAIAGGASNCYPDCTIGPPCGNGVLDPGELCDPPSPPSAHAGEDCSNRIDDNGNGLVDCGDPACSGESAAPFCSGTCQPGSCLPIKRDPVLLQFGEPNDFFSIHGRVDAEEMSFDPTQVNFEIMIANRFGTVLSAICDGSQLQPSGRLRWFTKDKSARFAEGGGMYRCSLRFRRVLREPSYTFKIRYYGDFSAANPNAPGNPGVDELQEMQTLVYGVGQGNVGFLRANWKPTGKGWQLRLSHLGGAKARR
jgi:hypothetical protein